MEFYEDQVLPAVFEKLDEVFPEFAWKRTPRGWTAGDYEKTKEVFGTRAERVVCNRPGGFLVYGGDAVAWTTYWNGGTRTTGADFVDAVKGLARAAGVDPSPLERELTPSEREAVVEREQRRDLLEDFLALAQLRLQSDTQDGQKGRSYLGGRGFHMGDLPCLEFGVCPRFSRVREYLAKRGHTTEAMDQAGVLKDSRWEGRLVIPWRDAQGYLATMGARDMTGEAEEGAKYLYLAGGTKPPALGLDTARRAPETRQEGLVVVEGLLDTVFLHTLGMPNAVALGGAGGLLTPERWEALYRTGAPSITLALDSDGPGQEGLEKALKNLPKVSQVRKVPKVYLVTKEALRGHKDPDELVRAEGVDAFRQAVSEAVPWTLYLGGILLGEVCPTSSERTRREAVERVLDLSEELRGERATLDATDLLHLAAEKTGYTFEDLVAIDLNARERRERERAEAELKATARDLQAGLEKGADAYELAQDFAVRLSAVQAVGVDAPPRFNPDTVLQSIQRMPEGRRTGWGAVDDLGVRFQAQELAVLGGRTGHGKTSALVGLLFNWLNSKDPGRLVLYSHEEPVERVFCRLLALETERLAPRPSDAWSASQAFDYLRNPSSRADWPDPEVLESAIGSVGSKADRLEVVHRPSWTAARIAAHARELAEEVEVGAVFVDYLQRIPAGEGKVDRRDQEVSAIGRTLKALAVDLSVPVVAGAQINREAIPDKYQAKLREKLKNGTKDAVAYMAEARPDLHNLREGGSEQEADLVLGLMNYAADLRQEAEDGHTVKRYEVGVLKNRYGEVGRWASLIFEGRYGLIRDRHTGDEGE